MRFGIMATGGVGGYFGAMLARGGKDVAFIARGVHLEAMRKDGLRVESVTPGEFSVREGVFYGFSCGSRRVRRHTLLRENDRKRRRHSRHRTHGRPGYGNHQPAKRRGQRRKTGGRLRRRTGDGRRGLHIHLHRWAGPHPANRRAEANGFRRDERRRKRARRCDTG